MIVEVGLGSNHPEVVVSCEASRDIALTPIRLFGESGRIVADDDLIVAREDSGGCIDLHWRTKCLASDFGLRGYAGHTRHYFVEFARTAAVEKLSVLLCTELFLARLVYPVETFSSRR